MVHCTHSQHLAAGMDWRAHHIRRHRIPDQEAPEENDALGHDEGDGRAVFPRRLSQQRQQRGHAKV